MKIINCRWLFKVKQPLKHGEEAIYKARLVVKGFTQTQGVDYSEVFASVVRHTTIIVLLALVAQEDLELHQLDIKTAFLQGDLDEVIHMQQAPGFESKEKGNVCLLKRLLYGLKQSPRQWYRKFHEYMLEIGFTRCYEDTCTYVKMAKDGGIAVYLLIYVDDMLVAANDIKEIEMVKWQLAKKFDLKDLGEASKILGMDIQRDRRQ